MVHYLFDFIINIISGQSRKRKRVSDFFAILFFTYMFFPRVIVDMLIYPAVDHAATVLVSSMRVSNLYSL